MELEGSLPHLQVPATCSYPKPYQSSQEKMQQMTKMTMWIETISSKGLTIRKLMASFQYFKHSVIFTPIPRVFKETIQACYDTILSDKWAC
jgi:hypothetical protein